MKAIGQDLSRTNDAGDKSNWLRVLSVDLCLGCVCTFVVLVMLFCLIVVIQKLHAVIKFAIGFVMPRAARLIFSANWPPSNS